MGIVAPGIWTSPTELRPLPRLSTYRHPTTVGLKLKVLPSSLRNTETSLRHSVIVPWSLPYWLGPGAASFHQLRLNSTVVRLPNSTVIGCEPPAATCGDFSGLQLVVWECVVSHAPTVSTRTTVSASPCRANTNASLSLGE